MPSLLNQHLEVRTQAIEALGVIYEVKGKELQDEVISLQ